MPVPGRAWRNDLGGTIYGPAVQAGVIHGGVHIDPRPGTGNTTPNQVPSASANFAGRESELAALDRITAEAGTSRRLTVVIVGPGGFGKTSLASYWLHTISDRYQGGALFTDLLGHQTESAAQPAEVLAGFLRAYGVAPDRIPIEAAEMASLFRTVTTGRKTITFLDNAASAAQVRVLLPGPGPAPDQPSLVVVTTRWRLTGLAMEGARFLELGPLNESAALDLFDRMIGAERASADDELRRSVVQMCGGVPLAICVTGARLAAHPRWPVSRIAQSLASERDRLSALSLDREISIRAAFDVSHRALPEVAADAFWMLALIPGPDFGLELGTATLNRGHVTTQEILDTLTDTSLLTETGPETYQFHDLVRLYAREQADSRPADKRRLPLGRAVAWFLASAVDAEAVISPSRWELNPMFEPAKSLPPAYPGIAKALDWAESMLPGLVGAIQAAHDEGMHVQAWQLCEASWGVLWLRKHFPEWITSHRIGLESARLCGDLRAESRMRIQLGMALRTIGQEEEATEHFTTALGLARQAGHLIGEATALEEIALTDLWQRRFDQAIGGFTLARNIHSQIGVQRGVALTTRRIGEVHRNAGRYEAAISDLGQARHLFTAISDPYMEARCSTSLGETYLLAGRLGDATATLASALKTMTMLGSPFEQARIRVLLGTSAARLGDQHSAREHLTWAFAVFDEMDMPQADLVKAQLTALAADGDPGVPSV